MIDLPYSYKIEMPLHAMPDTWINESAPYSHHKYTCVAPTKEIANDT
jgi:hypothetical protein